MKYVPKQAFTAKRRSRIGPQNEPQRFIILAQHYLETGNYTEAEAILSALVDVLNGNTDQKEMRDLALQMLKKSQEDSRNNAERYIMLTQSMANADALVKKRNSKKQPTPGKH